MNFVPAATPIAALDFSSRALKIRTVLAVKRAELFGTCKSPFKEAATTFDEMSVADIYYWIYKCTNPIVRTEDDRSPDAVFDRDLAQVRLPEDFKKQTTATLGAAGDILQADGLQHSNGVLYEKIADLLFNQDIAFANFESPLSETPFVKEVISDRAPPMEFCSREQFQTLKGHGGRCFDVLNTTNSHSADLEVDGIVRTLDQLTADGILAVGTHRSEGEYGKGKIIVKNGIKFGFVAATFGLNGRTLPPADSYRVHVAKLLSKFAPPDLDLVKRQIDHCKSEGCDFIIAALHWGFEFEFFPRTRQIEAAHALVEHGADSIICAHPHVVQPAEVYRTKRDPDRLAIIAYSLGSLVWGYTAPHLALSAILNLTLAKGVANNRSVTYVEAARVTPTFHSSVAEGDRIVTRIEKLADHLGGRSKVHPQNFIRQIKRFADLAFGRLSEP